MKTLFEDIFEEFGFRIVWEIEEHIIGFKVYEITAYGINHTPCFGNDACAWGDINENDLYLDGYLKWDGCMDINFHASCHFCGPRFMKKHIDLLKYLGMRGAELLGMGSLEDRVYFDREEMAGWKLNGKDIG